MTQALLESTTQNTLPNSLLEAAQQWQLGAMGGEWLHHVVAASKLAHGWVFSCGDTARSYSLALVLAKVLNCQSPPEKAIACGACRNCRWINDNAHPAVMTLSPRTMLVKEDSKDPYAELRKKVPKFQKNIHTAQVSELERQLAYRSEYTRVILITHAELKPQPSEVSLPAPHELMDVIGEDGNLPGLHFTPLPLSPQILAAHPTNKLLKTLEEPPPRCIFIFLTSHEDQLLDTIVSRCQVLPLNAPLVAKAQVLPEVATLITSWATPGQLGPRDNVDDHATALFEAAGDAPDWDSILVFWQQQLQHQFRGGEASHHAFGQYHARLQAVETCRQQHQSYVNIDVALRHLLFTLCHGQ